MNRTCDHRIDFYSLGAVLYELLTAAPASQSDDPLELIHWHIARVPHPPSELGRAIPATLSEIVMKLLAKTAEDRYQSAAGLHFDLEQCAKHWKERRDVPPFAIARRDVSERFTIPARLYGREPELETLLDAFDRSCRGEPRLMLVAGYSGIGKTSLIHELVKPIARARLLRHRQVRSAFARHSLPRADSGVQATCAAVAHRTHRAPRSPTQGAHLGAQGQRRSHRRSHP